MDFLNFFRNDFSKILGIYFDGDKIFLAYLADKIEFSEFSFDGDTNQLAEKISAVCAKNDWRSPKIALALREGTAATFQTEFKSVPENEIESAVKIWATANVGKGARYSSVKLGDEIWMEALPETLVEEFVDAFDKKSLPLCTLTEIPESSPRPLTPFNRAESAAEIALNNAAPNILNGKIPTWNFKRIALAAAAIFLLAVSLISVRLGYEYYAAAENLEAAQENLNALSELAALKENIDETAAEMRRLNELSATQNFTQDKFNALVKIGRLADGKIWLDKIKTSGDTLELAGTADTPDALKNYLSRLKSSMSDVRLENSASNDSQVEFLIRSTF